MQILACAKQKYFKILCRPIMFLLCASRKTMKRPGNISQLLYVSLTSCCFVSAPATSVEEGDNAQSQALDYPNEAGKTITT